MTEPSAIAKIIMLLEKEPNRAYSMRHIAILTEQHYTTVTKSVRALYRDGILKSVPIPAHARGHKRGSWYYLPVDTDKPKT